MPQHCDLHESLYPELAAPLQQGMPAPLVPIIDAHMHVGDVDASRPYVEAARDYGIVHALAMAGSPEKTRPVAEAFPDFFRLCTWPHIDDLDDAYLPQWQSRELQRLDAAADAGYVCFKMKIVPGDRVPPRVWMDDASLAPIFERALQRGLSMQVHLAQPDRWWTSHFKAEEVRPKRDYFTQLENILTRYPELRVVGCHMGCRPEDLDALEALFRRFPNYSIETSACKWVIREISAQREKARRFFIAWADRIMLGSDLVVQRNIHRTYYTSRFHVQRQMWETDFRGRSMIRDPDADGEPILHGLDLPAEVLRRIYRLNAERLYFAPLRERRPAARVATSPRSRKAREEADPPGTTRG